MSAPCVDAYPWQGLFKRPFVSDIEWILDLLKALTSSSLIISEQSSVCSLGMSSVLSPARAASSRKGSQSDDSLRLQASSLTQCQTCPSFPFFPLLATSCTAMIKFYFTDPFLFFLPPPSWYLLSEYTDADVVFAETRRLGRVIRYLERRKRRFQQMVLFLVVDRARWL